VAAGGGGGGGGGKRQQGGGGLQQQQQNKPRVRGEGNKAGKASHGQGHVWETLGDSVAFGLVVTC
jgi:hypothetical protein